MDIHEDATASVALFVGIPIILVLSLITVTSFLIVRRKERQYLNALSVSRRERGSIIQSKLHGPEIERKLTSSTNN